MSRENVRRWTAECGGAYGTRSVDVGQLLRFTESTRQKTVVNYILTLALHRSIKSFMIEPKGSLRTIATNQNYKIMKEDFNLLKVGTEVMTDRGVKTTIAEVYIYRPTNVYFDDAWDYVTEKHPDWNFDEGDPFDFDDRFVEMVSDPWLFSNDIYGDYIVLDLSKMSPDEIKWDEDYVCIDVSSNPTYARQLHDRLVPLCELELQRDITELTREELEDLYSQVSPGSIYYDDFYNDKYVDCHQVSDYTEGFEQSQFEEYGEDEYENHLTPAEFADYVGYAYA